MTRPTALLAAVLLAPLACSAKRAPKASEPASPVAATAPVAVTAPAEIDAGARDPNPRDTRELDAIVARVQKAVAPQIGGGKSVGAIVGISFQGERRVLAFGETRKGNRTPPDARTMFEIGSVTKTFTGLLLADQIERGQVKETDRIDAFRPEWKGQQTSDIRLIDLVTHRSGLPRLPCNLHPSDPKRPYADYGEEDLVRGLTDRELGGRCAVGPHPSEHSAYSNWGFGLLGYVLASSSKASYPALVRARIVEPLGLGDTTYDLSEDQRRRFGQGYTENGSESPLWDRKILFGNGALRSTVTDMLAYGEAWQAPEKHPALTAAFRRAATTQHQSAKGRIAYAWQQTPTGSLWHNGMTGGHSALVKVYKTRPIVVVVLSNTARDVDCVIEAVEDLKCTR